MQDMSKIIAKLTDSKFRREEHLMVHGVRRKVTFIANPHDEVIHFFIELDPELYSFEHVTALNSNTFDMLVKGFIAGLMYVGEWSYA